MPKNLKIILGVIAGGVLLLALAWYYQQEGLIKIFPTKEELEIKRVLEIDESLFTPPQGLPEEQKQQKLQELYEAQAKIKQNPSDQAAWFTFGFLKSFFNDHAGAAAAWEITYGLSPDFRTALNLGNEYQYFLKDYVKAETYYLSAIELKPDLTTAYQGLIDLYRFNWKEKSTDFEPLVLLAAEEDSLNASSYYAALVEFYVSDEYLNLDKAKQYLESAQSVDAEVAEELIELYPQLK